MNDDTVNNAVAGLHERLVMEPIRDDESGHCSTNCPYLKAWDHPFWNHTAWCWRQMKDLEWYDYWLADCISQEPDHKLFAIRENGRTKAP